MPLSAHSFLHVERPGTGIWVVPAQPWDCRQIASPPWGACVSPFLSPSSLDSQKSFPLLESRPPLLSAAHTGLLWEEGMGSEEEPGSRGAGGAHRGSELAGTRERAGRNQSQRLEQMPKPYSFTWA